MAIISLKSFDQIFQDLVFIVRSSTDKITDFNIGSVTRAYLEAIALMGQYLSSKIEELESAFYIDTAKGADLDRRLEDFGLPRKTGLKSSGLLSFYSFTTPSSDILIPIGTVAKTVKDENGSFLSYVTTEEITLTPYNSGSIFPFYSSGSAECTIAGTLGNLGAERIIELDSEISGVSGVINLMPFLGGTDAEIDSDYRSRGRLYLQSLAKGTENALLAAILGVEGINNASLLDWNDVDPLSPNAIDPGILKIILDTDITTVVPSGTGIQLGSNYIDKQIQIDVWNAIKSDVRAAGVAVIFEQTTLVPIDIEMNVLLTPDPDLNLPSIITISTFNTLFTNKIQKFFNDLQVNEDVKWSQILKLAINLQGVVAVTNVALRDTLNNPEPGALTPFEDIEFSDNYKGTLGTIKINGVQI